MVPEITKFCPECEREFPVSHEECPADGAPLMKYEVVEPSSEDRLVGAVLDDRYRVDEPLSEGGMGKIYRGTQTKVERDVAIKVLSSAPSRQETQKRRFLREARTLSQLSHPNIVNFIDFGEDARHDAVYLVMELIEGRDLSELVDGDRLAPALVTQIGIQVCAALAEPHHEGVVHRDLKPANLMLSVRVDGALETKLVDFGITEAVHDTTQLTQTGAVCGTPHYMAPEQVEGQDVTPSADIYALGAILFQFLTGEYVFDGKSDIQILISHVSESPRSLERMTEASMIPNPLGELVGRMLAKSPEARPDSVLGIRDELDAIRDEKGYEEIRIAPDLPIERAVADWVYEARPGPTSKVELPETGKRAAHHQTDQNQVEDPEGAPLSSSPSSADSVPVRAQSGASPERPSTASLPADSSSPMSESAASLESSGDREDSDQEGPSLQEMLERADAPTGETDDGLQIYIWLAAVLGLVASITGGLVWTLERNETTASPSESSDDLAGESTPSRESVPEEGVGVHAGEMADDESEPEEETAPALEEGEEDTPEVDESEPEERRDEAPEPELAGATEEDDSSGEAEQPPSDESTTAPSPRPSGADRASESSGGSESTRETDRDSDDEGFQPVTPSSSEQNTGDDGDDGEDGDNGEGESDFEPVLK